MAKSLVLAEKPSVARELARVLGCKQKGSGFFSGGNYIVTWALGHLVTLADPETYDKKYKKWAIEDLPMLPQKMQLVVIKETSKQFKCVQSLLRRDDVGEIIIATDSGREGELVARWILMKAGCKKPAKRLWISSQTDKSIRDGFKNLKPASAYYNLFLSAQARSEADWLVGLNVTRALTCKHNAQLSAGRVQTPTLAMIVEREDEIKHFVPKDYFTIKANLDGFNAIWMNKNSQSRIFEKEIANDILKKVSTGIATVSAVNKQYKHQASPPAYDLTELQRDANKKYAYSAKKTLSLMQSLYEKHKALTYPRTDSRYITQDIVPTLPDRLKSVAMSGRYKEMAQKVLREKPITRYIVDDKRVTDHHAIIPTEEPVNFSALTPEELNIYDLVVRRFIAVLSPAFEYEQVKVEIDINKEKFHAKGKVVKSLGWKSAYSSSLTDDDDDLSDLKEQQLPPIKQGEKITVKRCEMVTGKTKPPARYTEATLLTAMENPTLKNADGNLKNILKTTSGLGTPATRADIIEKLFSSFYVERQGKSLVPTSKGIQLMKIVPEELKSAELTAKWEQQLALIGEGKVKNTVFIDSMRDYARKLVSDVSRSDAKYTHDNITKNVCPECGKYLLEVKGKKGVMLVCQDRECGYRKSKTVITNARCPNCHKKMEIRGEGEKKSFYCVCGHRERVSDFEKNRESAGANKNDVRKYMQSQSKADEGGMSALAMQLAKWKEQNED